MKMLFKLIDVDKNHCVSKCSDHDFLLLIQRATLFALKEAGHLNEMQHRHAEAALLRQFREAIKANAEPSVDD